MKMTQWIASASLVSVVLLGAACNPEQPMPDQPQPTEPQPTEPTDPGSTF